MLLDELKRLPHAHQGRVMQVLVIGLAAGNPVSHNDEIPTPLLFAAATIALSHDEDLL